MDKRIYNFCAGPCTLPVKVLEELSKEMINSYGSGMSVIELSHRSAEYEEIHNQAIASLRSVLKVPKSHSILLLSGGATLQFSMIPLNLLAVNDIAGYTETGQWGNKAFKEAKALANVESAWSGAPINYTQMPTLDEITINPKWQYLHTTSNETIGGVRLTEWFDISIPLVVDASSDITTRPVDWNKVDLLYAGAQKNLGPAGLGIVIINNALVEPQRALPPYLTYKAHEAAGSLLNTPPSFQIWTLKLVLDWMQELGGVPYFEEQSAIKSSILYDRIDGSNGFYKNPVKVDQRSVTNIVFTTPSDELDAAFVKEAAANGFANLKGHRSVGGCRASVYNAMGVDGVNALANFMVEFQKKYS